METANKPVTVESQINAPVNKVWDYFNNPAHVTKWCFASDDWHCPKAEADLRTGGTFSSRMEAKDGSFGFDFGGVYDNVKTNELVEYTMSDGRKVSVSFRGDDKQTTLVETFDPESIHPVEFQKAGWQAILDNFRKYTEAN